MHNEPSGDYYDYTRTMQPERPWLVDWHQRFVYRHINALRGGTGMYSGDPEMAAARPRGQRWTFGDGKIAEVCMTFEDSLYTTSPYHAGFDGVNPPADFFERFCLETLPYYYRNNPNGNYDYGPIHDPADICMPALWCDEPTLIAYSKGGFTNVKWPLPPEWSDVSEIKISRLTAEGPEPRERASTEPGGISFSLLPNEAVCITPGQGRDERSSI